MEEPKKVLKAQYLGSLEVDQPTGMDSLNDAISKLVTATPVENWDNVNVSVAPSMISVNTSVSLASTRVVSIRTSNNRVSFVYRTRKRVCCVNVG